MAPMSRDHSPDDDFSYQDVVDKQVVSEVAEASAWDEPVQVTPMAPDSFSLPVDLAARAAFLARLHHEPATGDWLTRIIRERIELEEKAFAEARRELVLRAGEGS
jgi:hypothetical protein